MSARNAGVTLIEVMMGTLVVGLVIGSASWALSGATSVASALSEEPIDAALLAKEIHELALKQPAVDDGDAPATDAAGVHGLDSLDGASFCPPINASLAQVSLADRASWREAVNIQVYALSDLNSVVSEKFTAATKSSRTLYKLTVHLTFRGTDQGTWWWWINP